MRTKQTKKAINEALLLLFDTEEYGFQEMQRKLKEVSGMSLKSLKNRCPVRRQFYLAYYFGLRIVPYHFHGTPQTFDVEKWCRRLHVKLASKPKKYKVVIRRKKTHE